MSRIEKSDIRYNILKTIPKPEYKKKVGSSWVYLNVNASVIFEISTEVDTIILKKISSDPTISSHHTTKYETLSIHYR